MIIEWRSIPGFDDYLVSDKGKIFSLNTKGARFLKQTTTPAGYLVVGLSLKYKNFYKKKILKVHRLVMLAFNGQSRLTVNHKNGIKTDNRLENLEYCTMSENNKHAYLTGLKDNRGANHGRAKLSNNDIILIRDIYRQGIYFQRNLADIFNVSQGLIGLIVRKKNWTHI